MNRIKVVKKNSALKKTPSFKAVGENKKSGARETAEIVKGWITNWRQQREIVIRRTADDHFGI